MATPITRPDFSKDEVDDILKRIGASLESGILMLGPNTLEFEQKFSKRIGTADAVALNSCTSALTACLKYFNLHGGEVIVPSATFIATPNSAFYAGGKPVFAEIDERTLSLTNDSIKEMIGERTTAVVLVHLLGMVSPEVDKIRRTCRGQGIALIEDCAHAMGCTHNSVHAGNFSDAGCFSFYPTKVLTTFFGGMVTTDDGKLAAHVRCLRAHGGAEDPLEIVEFGNDWFLSEAHCAVGISQLGGLDRRLEMRNRLAKEYDDTLADAAGISLFKKPQNGVWNYYRYPVFVEGIDAVRFSAHFKKKFGIGITPVYVPCHRQPVYKRLDEYHGVTLPVTERMMASTLCLPLYPGLPVAEAGRISKLFISEVREWARK